MSKRSIDDQGDQANKKQKAANPISKDALGHVFTFLDIRDLPAVTRADKFWRMTTLKGSRLEGYHHGSLADLAACLQSPLRRHISSADVDCRVEYAGHMMDCVCGQLPPEWLVPHIAECERVLDMFNEPQNHTTGVTVVGSFYGDASLVVKAAEMLASNTTITRIEFDVLEMDTSGIDAIGAMLKVNTTLTSLTLGHRQDCSPRAYTVLADGLASNSTLTHLDVSGLSHVDVNDVDMSEVSIVALANGLAANSTITSVSFNDCRLRTRAIYIADALRNKPIVELSMNGNEIDDDTMIHLIDATSTMPITYLDIGRNLCTVRGITSIAKLDKPLTYLDISHTRLCDSGFTEIASMLTRSKVIKEIRMDACDITDAGMKSITEAMKHHPSLEHVSFNHNPITSIGAESIAQMMLHNNVLRILRVERCLIGNEGVTHLLTALEANKSIKILAFGQNGVSKEFEIPHGERHTSVKHCSWFPRIPGVN